VDPEARVVRTRGLEQHGRTRNVAARSVVIPVGRGVVGCLLDPAVSASPGAAPDGRNGRRSGPSAVYRRLGPLIGSILVVQFVGIPFSLVFGRLARNVGTKGAILSGLVGYLGISVFAYFIRTPAHFLILALGVAAVQGGTQALSRSLFATLIPANRSAECFSFF
jgi:MFS family permease